MTFSFNSAFIFGNYKSICYLNFRMTVKTWIVLFYILFLSGCEENNEPVNEQDPINYSFVLEYEDTGVTKDENNFFHLLINRNNWQTLYRVRGIVYKDDQPIDLMKFYWESNLYWELGDTLGYYIHRDLTDDLEYVSYDTTYVTGFSGMEVPTSNVSSVSNSDGEVSNMIAPVQSMIGDTLILSWVYYDWIYGNYAGEGSISIILD